MNDALFWANPAQLRVVDEMTPCLAPVGDERVKSVALDAVCKMGNGRAYDLVSTANCESLDVLLERWFAFGILARKK